MKSVIIPTWNAGVLIDDCLASISAQLADADELIVIDNASHDSTPDHISACFPHVKVVRLSENTGFAGGVNRGLQLARGAELFLINQDVVLRADCLAALSAQLAHGPAVVGCKLLYPDGVTLQHAGGIIRWPRAIADHYGYRQPDDGRWNTVRDVDYVTGAVVALTRVVLDTIGLLDEGFYPAYYEEVDYCFRARAAHARVIYEPLAVAVHHESQSSDKRTPAYHRAMERGRVRFVLKNSPPDQWLSEFFPAELDFVQHVAADYARDVCAPAYDEVLMNLPSLPPEHSDTIIQSLRQLRAAARQTWAAARQPAAVIREVSMPEPFAPLKVPDLREHEFQSNVPVIGPLIAGMRRALYAATAKWPLRVALEQQMRINRQLAQRLAEHEAWLAHYQSQLRDYENQLRDYEAQLRDYDERLIDQDHDLAHLSRVMAEVELRQRHQIKSQASPSP
jgi:O-antigen biosynthesis protein